MTLVQQTQSIEATIRAYISGFEAADLDAICSLFSEDASVEDPVGSPRRVGTAEIRAFYSYALSAKPKLKLAGEPVIVGLFSATPMVARVEMGGREIQLEFISVMSFCGDGRIRSMTAYFDPGSLPI